MPDPALASAPGRYAAALFSLAEESGSLDAVSRDMQGLAEMLRASPELRFALANPDFRQEHKRRALAGICERTGAHRLTRNCIGVLARRGRLALLGEVAGCFRRLLAGRRRERQAELVSAHPLSPERRSRIQALLEEAVGGRIRLSASVDPDLLSGLALRLGSLLIDCSLRTRLNNLAVAMKEAK